MAKRKAKPPAPNSKPPLLPPWLWSFLAIALGKSLGTIVVKLLGAVALTGSLWLPDPIDPFAGSGGLMVGLGGGA